MSFYAASARGGRISVRSSLTALRFKKAATKLIIRIACVR